MQSQRAGADDSEQLTNIMNSVVSFREKVRSYSLGGSTAGLSSKYLRALLVWSISYHVYVRGWVEMPECLYINRSYHQ